MVTRRRDRFLRPSRRNVHVEGEKNGKDAGIDVRGGESGDEEEVRSSGSSE